MEWLAPLYLGWSLGANDAANLFGTAVASRMLRFGTAAVLAALFVVVGAVLEGRPGLRTVGGLIEFDAATAVTASLGAAITITLMTLLRLPASTSQAVVGAIVGVGLFHGGIDLSRLSKVVLCWLGTPLGALAIAVVLHLALTPLFNRLAHRVVAYDVVVRSCLGAVGCYAAYALGANNVANVTGVFVGAGLLEPGNAAALGGVSIALGIFTLGHRVMGTIGRGIVRLNAYGALVVVLAEAITVHLYAEIGVPVSASQAVVGAVLGVGLVKSVSTVRTRAVLGIVAGWVATPLLAAVAAAGLYLAAHLRFVA